LFLLRLLYAWRRRAAPALGHLHVRMYTRQGCHLCEQAWEQLRESQARHGFVLTAEDVDATPELAVLHGQWVPVVEVDGKVRFRGRINPVLLRRLLRAEEVKAAKGTGSQ
jgi:hypothetical protein